MIWIIWLIFVLFFFLLAFYHWKEANKKIDAFKMPEIPYWEPDHGIAINTGILDKDIKKAFKDFEEGFNGYIKNINQSSKIQNRIQSAGYLIAGFTAVYSMFIT